MMTMTLAEIFPTIQELPRGDKLRLIQLLAAELIQDECEIACWDKQSVPIWSPFDAYEGAATLQNVLDQDKAKY